MDTKKLIGTIIGVTMFAVLIAGATFAWLTFGTTVTNNVYIGQTMNFLVDYTKGNAVNYMPILDTDLAKPNNYDDDDNDDGTSNGVGDNTGEAEPLVIVMRKHSGSTDGHAIVKLTTTSTTDLTKEGVVRWAICRDTNVEYDADGTTISATQDDDTCKNGTDFSLALNSGRIEGAGTIVLLNDAAVAAGANCANGNVGTLTKAMSNGTYAAGPPEKFTFSSENMACSDRATTTGTSSTNNMIEADGVSYFVYFWLDGKTLYNRHLDAQYSGSDTTTIVNNLYEGYVHASANQLQN